MSSSRARRRKLSSSTSRKATITSYWEGLSKARRTIARQSSARSERRPDALSSSMATTPPPPPAVVEEWRDDLHQLSYCYRAKLIDKTGRPELTDDEVLDGLTHEWIQVPDAINHRSACEPLSDLGHYIEERDLFVVNKYSGSHC